MSEIKRAFLGVVRGSRWYSGDKISGNDTKGKVYENSGVTKAYPSDYYLNLSTGVDRGKVYRCKNPGDAKTATWVYVGNIAGPTPDVINNLDSRSTTKSLSANMGRYLFSLLQSSLAHTQEIYPSVTRAAASIQLTMDNQDTDLTFTTPEGDEYKISYKAEGTDEIVTKTFALDQSNGFPNKETVVQKVRSSEATFYNYALLDGDSKAFQEDSLNIWDHTNAAENNILPDINISEDYTEDEQKKTASYKAGGVSKVIDGVRKTLYPVTHVQAIWWRAHERVTLFDFLTQKTNELTNHENNKSNPHKVTYEQAGAAPRNHASATTGYGAASTTQYGHVRIGNGLNVNNGVISWDNQEASEQEARDAVRTIWG